MLAIGDGAKRISARCHSIAGTADRCRARLYSGVDKAAPLSTLRRPSLWAWPITAWVGTGS